MRTGKKISFRRTVKFQFVAWIGTLVNLGALWLLKGKLKAPLIAAGACAIKLDRQDRAKRRSNLLFVEEATKMGMDVAFHYVCTRKEARELVKRRDRFWISNCGCREARGRCERSRMDVCLWFRDDITPYGTGFREISPGEVVEIFGEAEEKHLVSRPFRDEETRTKTDGICFCCDCDDCCDYFLNPEEVCDKGALIEKTETDECTNCGMCVDVCYFGARKMAEEELTVDRQKCYGCGLCVDVCPVECVEMVPRVE